MLVDYLSVQTDKHALGSLENKQGATQTKYTCNTYSVSPKPCRGWSGGAMVLGKLPVPGRPTIWIAVGRGPTAFAVGAGGSCLDIFTLIYPFCPLSPSLGVGPI